MDLGLTNKTVLVTGAAKGIGKGIVKSLAQEGANIVLHYQRSKETAEETAEEIQKLGGNVYLVQADLSKIDQVQKIKISIQNSSFGPLYGIVNNAGWAQFKSFFRYQPEEWRREVDICFYGVLNLAYIFLPEMIEQREGKFINIIGDSARTGDKNLILSAAARGGTISFMKSLAQEVGKHNIQCNVVSLGVVAHQSIMMAQETIDKIEKLYPLRRVGKVEDVVGMTLFLLSKHANWITGQVYSVNGGYSMIS